MRFVMLMVMCFMMVLFIGGCASSPDMVSTTRTEGERYSADEVREITVDQPFLLSGDYFRERSQKNKTIRELLGLEGGEKATGEGTHKEKSDGRTGSVQRVAQRVASSNQFGEDTRAGTHNGSLPVKVGFLLDRGQVSDATEQKIFQWVPQMAPAFRVLPVNQDQIHEALSISDCLERKDLLCIAGTLSLFPGVQMLALIERFDVPDHYPGSAQVRLAMVDTGIPFRYPSVEITASVGDAVAMDTFIKGVLHRVFDMAVAKSGVIPWFCRAFSQDDGKWYISAGERSGLTLGQQLQVVSEGRVIRALEGLPAGWLPGKSTGTLRVERFFGTDLAVCSLVAGKGPDPEDLIMLDRLESAFK